ncbi:MAG: hypothetical protein O2954_19775 [bacterium]|nr:hypothetical protein [bacterium]
MNWIFLGVIVGSIVYLTQIILSYLENSRASRDRIEQTLIDLDRLEAQLRESEHARSDGETRAAKLEEEALLLEQEISELQAQVTGLMPNAQTPE